jgi:SNF2 family DNA or RNA helicase
MNQITNSILSGLIKFAELKDGVQLQEQQERIKKKLKKAPGLLVYHGLGSGKTLASIAAGDDLGGKVNVVVPAALRENYRKEINQYVGKPKADFDVSSYEKASKDGFKHDRASLTVFDEAHRMGDPSSARGDLPRKAPGKVLLLTGTPVKNKPSEALPLLRGIARDRKLPKNVQDFDQRFVGEKVVKPGLFARLRGVKPGVEKYLKNKGQLAELIRGRVDYHPSRGEFPEVSHEFVETEMTQTQSDIYKGLMSKNPLLAYKIKNNLPPDKKESEQLNAFLSGIRQISNDPATYDVRQTARPNERSPKIRKMFTNIMGNLSKDPGHKHLVYSNYLRAGVMPLAEELSAAGVSYGIFHGGLSDKQRKQVVDDYNNNKLQVILISGAGAEGLDLKGTRTVQVMEPHWNAARIRQVVGRAVRNKSHSHLPPDQRNVKVEYHMVRPPPQQRMMGLIPSKYEQGADRYLLSLAQKKQRLVDEMLNIFQEEGMRHE